MELKELNLSKELIENDHFLDKCESYHYEPDKTIIVIWKHEGKYYEFSLNCDKFGEPISQEEIIVSEVEPVQKICFQKKEKND